MPLRSLLSFAFKAVVVGLATAFVILWTQTRFFGGDGVLPRMQGPYSYATAVERAAPAVVNINTAKVVTLRRTTLFDDPAFRRFFGLDIDELIGPRQRIDTSLGSGVIVDKRGLILTNHHVIGGADAIQVWLRDGRTAPAKVVGVDPDTDIAVLKVELDDLPVIALGRSERTHVGDVVLAIGNPFGIGQTVTMGIVSATGRNKLGINTFENFIQTDAAINPGNSGGALVDADGRLIGINAAIISPNGGNLGIGLAVPVSIANDVLSDIVQYGRTRRGWLGVEAESLTPEAARARGLVSTNGVLVTNIVRNGPAHKAGLHAGDVVTAIDGNLVSDGHEATMAIMAHRPDSRVLLTLLRGGKELTLEAVASERPPRKKAAR